MKDYALPKIGYLNNDDFRALFINPEFWKKNNCGMFVKYLAKVVSHKSYRDVPKKIYRGKAPTKKVSDINSAEM
jgi:hypothetical protein